MTTSNVDFVEYWETVSLSALPAGWRNAYRKDGKILTEPCPALLLQELRSVDRCEDVPNADGTYTRDVQSTVQQPPYTTRAVFAQVMVHDLEPAVDMSTYVGTVPPRESPERYVSELDSARASKNTHGTAAS